MKMFLAFILFITPGARSFAIPDTAWLNNKWQPCERGAAYYCSVSHPKGDLWQQEIYYSKTGSLCMTGYFKDAGCSIKSGPFKWYYNTGSIKDSIVYENNNPRYLSHFHANGKVKTILMYNGFNKAIYVDSWTAEGFESYIDTFYHDRKHNECNKDTAYLEGIIVKEDSGWHLRFYYLADNRLYINSWYKERLCTTRIKDFERYNEDGKLIDSAVYFNNGKKQAVWLYYDNCMISSYKTYDSTGVLTGWTSWDEQGMERIHDPSLVYPSQPCGFRAWKKQVIAEINNDYSIDRDALHGYFGNIHVKLVIDREGKLIAAFIPRPSAFPAMDKLIVTVCKTYEHWKPGTVHGIKSDFLLNCNFFFTAGVVTGYQQSY